MRLIAFEQLETQNLILRKFRSDDAEAFYKRVAGNAYTWAIAHKKDDSVIGGIDLLRIEEEGSRCSFAYMIGDEFWGRGFGTETLSAVLQFAFGKMEIREVVADHMSENIASGAVMRKVGMSYVATRKAKYEKAGKIHDADEYKISSEDWRHTC